MRNLHKYLLDVAIPEFAAVLDSTCDTVDPCGVDAPEEPHERLPCGCVAPADGISRLQRSGAALRFGDCGFNAVDAAAGTLSIPPPPSKHVALSRSPSLALKAANRAAVKPGALKAPLKPMPSSTVCHEYDPLGFVGGLHQRGINVRQIGLLHAHVRCNLWKRRLMVEMLARAMKHRVRENLQRAAEVSGSVCAEPVRISLLSEVRARSRFLSAPTSPPHTRNVLMLRIGCGLWIVDCGLSVVGCLAFTPAEQTLWRDRGHR